MNKKIVPVALFDETAQKNGYEVFTAEEIADYYRTGLMKSQAGKMTEAERDEFIADTMYLQKAICMGEDGKEVTRYYRKEQVAWEVAADGTILKGIEGTYKDTPENKRLGRVGQAYVASEEVVKSLQEDDLYKSIEGGVYADTPENQALNRVGQPYVNFVK